MADTGFKAADTTMTVTQPPTNTKTHRYTYHNQKIHNNHN